ncbi:MAG: hypothetical protein KIS74_03060 [Burkholderiales bacterium]|nr:hypothetical protein [Burkholderiales bacterium]
MDIDVTLTDNSENARRRYEEAARLGIDAAANVLVREVKKAFGSDYYKGGAFRGTLGVRGSITRTNAERGPSGWSAQVGTRFIEALYWELGHFNTFTRQHERVRIWEPTAIAQEPAMRAAFARVAKRVMDAP